MAYPAETWAKVRADYETGNFSVRELSENYQIFYKTIDDKIASDGWIKGKYKPAIEAKIKETMIERFTRMGLSEVAACEKVVELIKKGDKKGLDFYFKLTGAYVPVKKAEIVNEGNSLIPSNMTREEIDERIRRMIK